MKQIADHVRDIIYNDVSKLELLVSGMLNTSAYAHSIIPEIESRALITPSHGSVVMALSRIKREGVPDELKRRLFEIDSIEVELPITELVFTKKGDTFGYLSAIYKEIKAMDNTTLNVLNVKDEVDIFCSSKLTDLVQKTFENEKCLDVQSNLAAITIHYNPDYRSSFGMASQIFETLASNRVNMLETVTTYSSIVIYIHQDQSQKCLEVLQSRFVAQLG